MARPAALGATCGHTHAHARSPGVAPRPVCGVGRGGAEPGGAARSLAGRRSRGSLNAAPRLREVLLSPADPARATAMSWELLLSLLALGALLAFVVQLLRFLRADGDLTLLWAEWQGRRPGEDPQPPLGSGRPRPAAAESPLSPHLSGWRGASARQG